MLIKDLLYLELLKATNRTNSKYVCTYVLKKWKSTHKKTIMYSAIATILLFVK